MKELKLIFGVLLIIAGVSSIIMAFAMASHGVTKAGGQSMGEKLFFGIGFLGLGVFLLRKKKPQNQQ